MITIEEVIDNYEDVVKMDGFDDCIMGICYRFGQPIILAYDLDKVTKKLMKQGMSYEDAIEYWEYNQLGASVGEQTPCYIERISK